MNLLYKPLGVLALMFSPVAHAICNTQITPDTPSERFEENADDSVSDKITGLLWKRCSVGQSWNAANAACDGSATQHTWQAALTLAQNAGGDWRLPNSKELASIVEHACVNPAINAEVFPDTVSGFYWSSSPSVGNSYSAWNVNFYHGNGYSDGKNSSRYVRLVRGGL